LYSPPLCNGTKNKKSPNFSEGWIPYPERRLPTRSPAPPAAGRSSSPASPQSRPPWRTRRHSAQHARDGTARRASHNAVPPVLHRETHLASTRAMLFKRALLGAGRCPPQHLAATLCNANLCPYCLFGSASRSTQAAKSIWLEPGRFQSLDARWSFAHPESSSPHSVTTVSRAWVAGGRGRGG